MVNNNMMKATYKAGYADGHADGYQKATREFDIHSRIMDEVKLNYCQGLSLGVFDRGFFEGWQARQKEIDKLRKELESAQLEISLLRDTLNSYEEKKSNTENLMWEVTVGEAENVAYNKGYRDACKDVSDEMKDIENFYELDGGKMWCDLKDAFGF